MKLLPTQKNVLFKIIESHYLSPIQFSIVEGNNSMQVLYKPASDFKFVYFVPDSSSSDYCYFIPGEKQWRSINNYVTNFNEVSTCFAEWLIYLAREISAGDLWADLKKATEDVPLNLPNLDNNRFSLQEYQLLSKNLDTLSQRLGEVIHNTQDIQTIQEKLQQVKELALNVGKFDWRSQFVGLILNIAVAMALPQDVVQKLWLLIKEIFNGSILLN